MKTYLGIELGSTRIKSVLVDESYQTVASGSFNWENRLENGIWTYHLDDMWAGLRESIVRLLDNYSLGQNGSIVNISGMGVSAMMHGYLPLDREGNQLTSFRTWRNTTTAQAAGQLTRLFGFNIPLRWSIAHLYQAILNDEEHVGDITFLTTLAGYVHYKLTGEKVLGIDDASGMFPIDSTSKLYHPKMLEQFDALVLEHNLPWKLADILPRIMLAGQSAGSLSEEGAKLLDPTGKLKKGIPFCPPEGDAGTGMVATNSVTEHTGNVSAGTSIFAMVVLDSALSKLHTELDVVATPTGKPVAMVHCNNCTSDIDAWMHLFGEVISLMGGISDKAALYDTLYQAALVGDADCGGLLSCNYLSGEHITQFDEGRPLFVRSPEGRFNLANFMRTLLFSALAALKLGMDILTKQELVQVDALYSHGGLFKTENVAQRLLAGALNVPVSVMGSAGEGGAWGIALLAAFMAQREDNETLDQFLSDRVFANHRGVCLQPDPQDVEGFESYMRRYCKGLAIEQSAIENLV